MQQAVDHEVEVSGSELVGEVGSPQEYVKSGCTCTQNSHPKRIKTSLAAARPWTLPY